MPWYPASVTKVMTAYVTLQAVKERRLTLDTLLAGVGARGAPGALEDGLQARHPGHLDNALKMLMVKSANDMAVVLAEGVSGSVEKFSDEMNQISATARHDPVELGQSERPAGGRARSPRRATLRFSRARCCTNSRNTSCTGTFRRSSSARRIMRNYNTLIGRYPGADGMKTGFICASGFNLVATASRNGKRLIAVVLGSPSGRSARRRPPACSSAASAAARCPGSRRRSAAWNRCSRSMPRRPTCATKCAASIASARPPRKRRRRADHRGNGANPLRDPQLLLSALPPSNGKPSTLLGPAAGRQSDRRCMSARPRSRPKPNSPPPARSSRSSRQARQERQGRQATPLRAAAGSRDAHTAACSRLPNVVAYGGAVKRRIRAGSDGSAAAAPPPGTFAPPPDQFTRSTRRRAVGPERAQPILDELRAGRARRASAADRRAGRRRPRPTGRRRADAASAAQACRRRRQPNIKPNETLAPRRAVLRCGASRPRRRRRLSRVSDSSMLAPPGREHELPRSAEGRHRLSAGALRALKMTTPIAKNPTRVFPVVIDELAEKYGDAPALLSDRERFTYRALAERANRYARWALAREPAQGRDRLPADAEPAGIHGGLARHHRRWAASLR